ncbi:MAG: tRNA guanosine(34) transglycosylase Tgt [Candidatus Diapherotrites archaeon]|nr:tRNA guanosine(34) transglycosylase Tgt [Candidatus Diapherotrites archaeon]
MTRVFSISGQSGHARNGIVTTAHGKVKTPFFMPVATKGSVKLATMEELEAMGTRCFISNSYVFSLRPGLATIKKAGGIHRFVGWEHSIFTDSGGFQVLRPEFFRSINDREIVFRNPFDQKIDSLSPEKAMKIQSTLSSDVAMCLDDMPVYGSTPARLKESMQRTTAWAKRCLDAHANKKQLLFGICQGGTNPKLRRQSAAQIGALPFDGFAIGGLAIGESMQQVERMVSTATPFLPSEKPRYLMGVGTPSDMLSAISLGIDCFDSAFPTQIARHGSAFSHKGRLNISNAKFRFDLKPLDAECTCLVCESHSRAYVHHLFRTGEENGQKYLSLHNLAFLQDMLESAREAIGGGRFDSFAEKFFADQR